MNVMVWNEFWHEKQNPVVFGNYPDGIHSTIQRFLQTDGFQTRTATLEEPEHGLTEETLLNTDVLIWWGHKMHDAVSDEVVARVCKRVMEGMGLVVLHSGHFSKVFKRLMGTSCDLKWREAGEKERLWVVQPSHPITEGIGEYIELQEEEMYGEFFDIPEPDELIFVSWFQGGEVFRSGCTFNRGGGKIFYFRPGHEKYPTYHHPQIQKIISNAVRWAAPSKGPNVTFGNAKPIEILKPDL